MSIQILDERKFSDLNEMRIYRNSIVHSEDPKVSKKAEQRLISLNDELDRIIKERNQQVGDMEGNY